MTRENNQSTQPEESPPTPARAGIFLPERFGAREIMVIAVASEGFLLIIALLIAWLGRVELAGY